MQVNNSTIGSRIKSIREKSKLTQFSFADSIGVSRSVLSQIEIGKIKPSVELIAIISSKFRANYPYLIDGEGTKILDDDVSPYGKNARVGIPLIPAEAVETFKSNEASSSELEYYHIPEFEKNADFLMRIADTGMLPKYSNGDVIACKKISIKAFLQWGRVYLVGTKQGLLCKRLVESNKGENYVRVVSDNEKFSAFDLNKNEIRSLALVVGAIHLE